MDYEEQISCSFASASRKNAPPQSDLSERSELKRMADHKHSKRRAAKQMLSAIITIDDTRIYEKTATPSSSWNRCHRDHLRMYLSLIHI